MVGSLGGSQFLIVKKNDLVYYIYKEYGCKS